MEMTPAVITAEALKEILAQHKLWLETRYESETKGERANLAGAILRGAILRGAILRGANLYGANLYGAILRGADLRGADLRGADLRGADLRGADLYGANLRSADLRSADLRSADLRGANLGGANLRGASLRGAILRGANLADATMPFGETWEKYLSEVVPALLTAGGKSIKEVVEAGWDCHTWDNCPMACAFGISKNATPIPLRPRVNEFVRFFDAGLIPEPTC